MPLSQLSLLSLRPLAIQTKNVSNQENRHKIHTHHVPSSCSEQFTFPNLLTSHIPNLSLRTLYSPCHKPRTVEQKFPSSPHPAFPCSKMSLVSPFPTNPHPLHHIYEPFEPRYCRSFRHGACNSISPSPACSTVPFADGENTRSLLPRGAWRDSS